MSVTVKLGAKGFAIVAGDKSIASGTGQSVMRLWNSYNDPPRSWYKTYSSCCYTVEALMPHALRAGGGFPYRKYKLTPLKGRVVYTFDDWHEIVESTRDFPRRLLFGVKPMATNLPLYYPRRGPPCELELEALQPWWEDVPY